MCVIFFLEMTGAHLSTECRGGGSRSRSPRPSEPEARQWKRGLSRASCPASHPTPHSENEKHSGTPPSLGSGSSQYHWVPWEQVSPWPCGYISPLLSPSEVPGVLSPGSVSTAPVGGTMMDTGPPGFEEWSKGEVRAGAGKM